MKITREFYKLKNEIPTYAFSKIEYKDLRNLFDIERVFDNEIFHSWFDSDINLNFRLVLVKIINLITASKLYICLSL